MKLSLCIATYNEEKFIHYPLDSAYDFVDEVIIVDGRSTDKTVEKAASYGAKIQVFPSDNPPMFHINKQKAIEKASGEWILQLDADEKLSKELKKEIIDVIARRSRSNPDEIASSLTSFAPRNDTVAYNIPRKNFFLGRFLMKGGQYPDYTIRLYRNGVVYFPCKSVHENVELLNPKSEIRNPKQIEYLKNPILHYADKEFSRYYRRWKRYIELEASNLLQEVKSQKSKVKIIDLFITYVFIKPISTFFSMYIRHKGFMDGWQGFVFAFFSSGRFIVIFFKSLL